MKRVNAKIHRHWQGEELYSLELELRPEYVAAAIDVHVDGQGLIQRLAVNSASFGSAVWQAGKGLAASYRWESDDEAATTGAWNGMLTAHGARRSGSQNAYRAAAEFETAAGA